MEDILARHHYVRLPLKISQHWIIAYGVETGDTKTQLRWKSTVNEHKMTDSTGLSEPRYTLYIYWGNIRRIQ